MIKKFQRIKRPARQIRLNGKLLNPSTHKPKKTAKSRRRPIRTPDGLVNEVVAAEYLGRAISTLQNRRSQDLPPKYTKVGGRVFYDLKDLDNFMRIGEK